MPHLDFVVVDGKRIANGDGADFTTMSHPEELFAPCWGENIVFVLVILGGLWERVA